MKNDIYIYIVIFGGFVINGIMLFIAITKLSLSIEHRITKLESVYEVLSKDIEKFFRKIEKREEK